MPEKKGKKVIIAVVSLIVLAVLAVLGVILFLNRDKSYRSIRVIDIKGDVTVKRGGKELEAYESMKLLSGDKITTGKGAELELQLDEDKHVILRENSVLKLEATGNAENSKTKLRLEVGEVYSKIENKLSKDSSYEVLTPGASMSVRGTIFTVTYREHVLKVAVEEGKVHVKVDSANESVDLEAGESAEYLIEEPENKEDANDPNSVTGNGDGGTGGDDNDTTLDLGQQYDWVNRYLEMIRGYDFTGLEANPRLGFAWIDDDSIPEMYIVEGDAHYQGVRIYTTDGVRRYGFGPISGNGSTAYWERSGALEDHYAATGEERIRFLILPTGEVVLETKSVMDYDTDTVFCWVNGTEASEQEYWDALAEVAAPFEQHPRKYLSYQDGVEFNKNNYIEPVQKALLQMVGIDISVSNRDEAQTDKETNEPDNTQSTGWRNLYLAALEHLVQEQIGDHGTMDLSMKLVDITGGRYPELLVASGSGWHSSVWIITTWDGTPMCSGGYGEYGELSYLPKKGIFGYQNTSVDSETIEWDKIEEGMVISVLKKEKSRSIYYVNGEVVTQQEYITAEDSLYDTDMPVIFRWEDGIMFDEFSYKVDFNNAVTVYKRNNPLFSE